jgi:hypothetical protein
MQKSVLITLDGPSLEALIFDAVDRAIKVNRSSSSQTIANEEPYGDFHWLRGTCPGIPASTLRIKSAAGQIPGVVKVGKRRLYEKEAVLNWLRSQTRVVVDTVLIEQSAEAQFNRQLNKKGGERV